jgi:hypothetical protein
MKAEEILTHVECVSASAVINGELKALPPLTSARDVLRPL